jgi:hypothetical protein
MRRAQEQGFTTPAYSGSTHDIQAFNTRRSSPEGDWGKAAYSSNNIDEVNANYAGEGPDLTARLENRADEIISAAQEDDYLMDEFTEKAGMQWEDMNYTEQLAIAMDMARQELKGPSEGAVYPLLINTDKFANIGRNSSILNEDPTDLALTDRIYQAMERSGAYPNNDITSRIADNIDESGISATDIDAEIRRDGLDAYTDDGEIISAGGVSGMVLDELGFEGVIDNTVNNKWGSGKRYGTGMAGMNPDTDHIVTFPGREHNIRSRYAAFDPDNVGKNTLLGGLTAAAIIRGQEAEAKPHGEIKAPKNPKTLALANGIRALEGKLKGHPASMLVPTGTADWLYKMAYDKKPNNEDRLKVLMDFL